MNAPWWYRAVAWWLLWLGERKHRCPAPTYGAMRERSETDLRPITLGEKDHG